MGFKSIIARMKPSSKQADDGRDQWPSRTAFILASLSGVIGMGNFLRYPSTVFNNNGIQWFIPYFLALILLAVPALALELAAGNAYRGGAVTAYNKISKRMRGIGFAANYVGFIVTIYFIPIIAWGMVFFQKSFEHPLPWAGNTSDYFMYEVTAAVDQDTSGDWVGYTDIDFDGRLVGWNLFLWVLVYLSIFKGTSWTGKVVYFTMGLPLVVMVILVGRGASLPNAGRGIKLYFGEFHADKLAGTQIWQAAVGQVFYSTGVGFGFYTAYASYNHKHANAAQDAVLLCFTNAFLEAFLAFAAFGIIGFMGMTPDPENPVGSYGLGFMTYPEAFVQMPGSNFWSALFFFTLMVVGVSSSFVMLDAVMTLIMDSPIAIRRNWTRPWVSAALVTLVALLSLPNCTQFGYWYMDGIDRWINNVGLVFVVWAESVAATTIYRYKDVVTQIGLPSFVTYQVAYLGGQLIAIIVGHTVSIEAGAIAGFVTYIVFSIAAVLIAKTPDSLITARMFKRDIWGKNKFLQAFYYMAFYSGNQLRHDLNSVTGVGKNWSLPSAWPVILRYVTGPVLAIILSLAYPDFETVNHDPLHILGFIVAHFLLVWVVFFFFVPQWLDVFIVPERREDWKQPVAPNVLRDSTEGVVADGLETGSTEGEREKKRDFDGRRDDSDLLSGNSETLDGVSSSSRSDDMAGQMRRPDPVADNKADRL